MAKPIKIVAGMVSGKVEIKIFLTHAMETGQRKDAKGKPVPAHFIQNVTATWNGKTVINAQLGPLIAKNPVLSFRFTGGKPGEKIAVAIIDNKGGKQTEEALIA